MKKSLLFLSLIASFTSINAQWTSQATGFTDASRGLSEISIVDANTVWALAYDGSGLGEDIQEFTRTTNGGASWTTGIVDMGNPALEINNISPVSGDIAWVSALIPTDGNGVIFKTIDGGVSWTQQLDTGFQTTGQSFLNSVYFWDANIGIAYGDPVGNEFEVYRTVDGGENWTAVPAASLPNKLAGEYGYNNSPIAVGSTLWFTTSKGRLYRTNDMGITWTVAQAPLVDFGGVDTAGTTGTAIFSDANNGFLLKTVGTARTYATTSNGGTTWTATAPFTGTRFILNYIPGTNVIVATSQAAPVGTSVSANNGATWSDVESAAQRGASAFLNMTTGWTAGFSTDELTDGIFKLTGQLGTSTTTAAKFKVYPNPASSVVTISTPEVESTNLSVTDLSGKVVMTRSLNGIENTVDISALSSGAYFFELSSDSKKEVVKILKN
jgi:photosystem II stability/assembly factor-like uncharacterized protein